MQRIFDAVNMLARGIDKLGIAASKEYPFAGLDVIVMAWSVMLGNQAAPPVLSDFIHQRRSRVMVSRFIKIRAIGQIASIDDLCIILKVIADEMAGMGFHQTGYRAAPRKQIET